MTTGTRSVLAGAIGGGVFVLFYIFMGSPILFALVFSSLAYIGTQFLLPASNRIRISAGLARKHGLTPEMIREVIEGGQQKVARMKALEGEIRNPEVQRRVSGIVATTEKIFADLEQDPKDIKNARQFLNYYLDATLKVIDQYARIAATGGHSQKTTATLQKVEGLLDTLDLAYKKQLQKLYEDEVMDLDVEMSVLEKTIKMEGMGE